MYLIKRGLLPNYFREMFTLTSQIHSHNTRNSNLFYIFPCRTNIRNFSIRFQGPKLFNSISPEIQNSESVGSFGKRLKKFLLSQSPILDVELHTFTFSLFLCISFFSFILTQFHSVPFTLMMYPIFSGSLQFISPRLLYRLPCHYQFQVLHAEQCLSC